MIVPLVLDGLLSGVYEAKQQLRLPGLHGVSGWFWKGCQATLGQRSMIDFVIVSSDLWLYILDFWVKRGADLSTDRHLVVSWICW